jgi:hypothetical protein
MVFAATSNNISVISWMPVLLVGETEFPEKTTELQIPDKPYHMTPQPELDSNSQHQWGETG